MIERHGNTTGIPGLPVISQVVTHNGLVHLCEVTPDPSGDMTTLFDEHNLAWNEWVDARNPAARACVESKLWRDGMLVEVMATAAAGQ